MYLQELHLINFKNIRDAKLSFIQGINCFVGKNGAGKTNLLDSLYFLSFCKSYFNINDNQLIFHGEDFFIASGVYNMEGLHENINSGYKRNQKKHLKRNKKEYQRLSDHIGLIPLVIISPGDERVIVDGGEQRRKFIDSVIAQVDKGYLELLLRYNRVLTQRNFLLKSSGGNPYNIETEIEIWNNQLSTTGQLIHDRRAKFVVEIMPVFQNYHTLISGNSEVVNINYQSHHNDGSIEPLLSNELQKDILLGYTTRGIHRDDLELTLSGYPIKKIGSQGQKKTFMVALKLAQVDYIKKARGVTPILLLDDLFDKLDSDRGDRLVELAGSDLFNQIFITDTQQERLMNIAMKKGNGIAMFKVENGIVNALTQI